MKKLCFALVAMFLLAGCDPDDYQPPKVDRKLMAERFDACMKALPAGPVQTEYNDWDEVVSQCHRVSHYHAIVDRE